MLHIHPKGDTYKTNAVYTPQKETLTKQMLYIHPIRRRIKSSKRQRLAVYTLQKETDETLVCRDSPRGKGGDRGGDRGDRRRERRQRQKEKETHNIPALYK